MNEFIRCLGEVLKRSEYKLVDSDFGGMLKIMSEAYINSCAISIGMNFRYDPVVHGYTTCEICQKDFVAGDVLRDPDCKHIFHAICICKLEDVVTKTHTCPICHANIEDRLMSLDDVARFMNDNPSTK